MTAARIHSPFPHVSPGVHVGLDIMRAVTINPPGETPDVGIPRGLASSMTIGEQQEWLRRYLASLQR